MHQFFLWKKRELPNNTGAHTNFILKAHLLTRGLHSWLKVATSRRSAFYAVVKYHEPDVEMECIIRLQKMN